MVVVRLRGGGPFAFAGADNASISEIVVEGYRAKDGTAKLVPACTYPLTGIGCVSRVYSDLAIFDITPQGVKVIDTVPGLSLSDLQALVPGVTLQA